MRISGGCRPTVRDLPPVGQGEGAESLAEGDTAYPEGSLDYWAPAHRRRWRPPPREG